MTTADRSSEPSPYTDWDDGYEELRDATGRVPARWAGAGAEAAALTAGAPAGWPSG